MDEKIVGEVADRLLHVAFHWEEFEQPPQVVREHLTAEQRAVQQAIAARDFLWIKEQESQDRGIWSGLRQDLHFLDLPPTQQDLRAFLALGTPQENADLA